jgi:hypothetical protein
MSNKMFAWLSSLNLQMWKSSNLLESAEYEIGVVPVIPLQSAINDGHRGSSTHDTLANTS